MRRLTRLLPPLLAGAAPVCYNTLAGGRATLGRAAGCPSPPGSTGTPWGPRATRVMKKGVPVSPGVAVAHAHCVEEVITSHEPYTLDDANVSGEVSRFERATRVAAFHNSIHCHNARPSENFPQNRPHGESQPSPRCARNRHFQYRNLQRRDADPGHRKGIPTACGLPPPHIPCANVQERW